MKQQYTIAIQEGGTTLHFCHKEKDFVIPAADLPSTEMRFTSIEAARIEAFEHITPERWRILVIDLLDGSVVNRVE